MFLVRDIAEMVLDLSLHAGITYSMITHERLSVFIVQSLLIYFVSYSLPSAIHVYILVQGLAQYNSHGSVRYNYI